MQQAIDAVCWAESDDEDYVSFDQQELDQGIAELYDEDSASDYNEDVEEEDEEEDLDELMVLEQQAHELFQTPQEAKPSIISSLKKRFSRRSSLGSPSAPPASAPSKKSKASQLNKRMSRLRKQKERKSREKAKKVVHRQKVNTNIISIDLGTLKTAAENIATGDACVCASCHAILSKEDELLKEYEDIKLDDEDESIWICRFCNYINIVQVDYEEMPKAEMVDYILEPPPQSSDDAKSSDSKDVSSQTVVFCVDVSGSMCVSSEVDPKHSNFKLRGSRLQQDHDDLSQFIDGNAGHLNQQTATKYVSRLQCVQTAVDDQIERISKASPNHKLGLVTFANDVTVIGDGMSTHTVIAGSKLNNMEKLREIGQQCVINNNIGKAHDKLSDSLWKLQESGQTALGPGLVVAIEMAAAKAGSQVILCTDGLANIGVGSLEQAQSGVQDMIVDDDEEEDPVLRWYQTLGQYAMSKGVVVNIISITDDGCKLENLGKIAEITNGSLRRIDPLNLADKFSGIIENESIATNAQTKLLLHPGLMLHDSVKAAQLEKDDEVDVQPGALQEEQKEGVVAPVDSKIQDINKARKVYKIPCSVQDCGNVFDGSRIFFEYAVNKKRKHEFKDLKQLPFQTQIEYTRKDGAKCLRVISQIKEITMDKQRVRKNLNFDILAKHGTHVTTALAQKGDYESSRAWTSANTHYMNRMASNDHQKILRVANYCQQNVALDHQMQRQIQTEMNRHELNIPSEALEMSNSSAPVRSGFFSKTAKKKKRANRQKSRNDQFSSHIYNMKKKSHK